MNIALIGSGNTCTVLGRKIISAGHRIVLVFSQHEQHAAALAKEMNCAFTNSWDQIHQDADLYLVGIADDALKRIAEHLFLNNRLVVHTAGSCSMDTLEKVSRNYGVLYPLQSLNRKVTHIPEIPFLVDGNTIENLTLIQDFAMSLSRQVIKASDDQRMKLHLAAVMVNNFSNHLYALAEAYCRQEQVNFDYLLPLIEETAARLKENSPKTVQTGPAIRGDRETIDKHLSMLEDYPLLKDLYRLFAQSIRQFHHPK